MNDYYDNMFCVPLVNIQVRNWETKKKTILDFYKNCELEGGKNGKVLTNFYNDPISFNEIIENLFDEELDALLNKLDIKTKKINASWFEASKFGNYHPVHTHGCYGYSAVCYVEYDKEVHQPTIFVSPFLNLLDGNVLEYIPNVNEGSIIFFPSTIVHYTEPNNSEKERIILSFNLGDD